MLEVVDVAVAPHLPGEDLPDVAVAARKP